MRSLKFLVITGASDPDEFGSVPFEQKAPNSIFLNSYFMSKLLQGARGRYCYDNVMGWTGTENIFLSEFCFFPVNIANYH